MSLLKFGELAAILGLAALELGEPSLVSGLGSTGERGEFAGRLLFALGKLLSLDRPVLLSLDGLALFEPGNRAALDGGLATLAIGKPSAVVGLALLPSSGEGGASDAYGRALLGFGKLLSLDGLALFSSGKRAALDGGLAPCEAGGSEARDVGLRLLICGDLVALDGGLFLCILGDNEALNGGLALLMPEERVALGGDGDLFLCSAEGSGFLVSVKSSDFPTSLLLLGDIEVGWLDWSSTVLLPLPLLLSCTFLGVAGVNAVVPVVDALLSRMLAVVKL
jgi:hypothetical protein